MFAGKRYTGVTNSRLIYEKVLRPQSGGALHSEIMQRLQRTAELNRPLLMEKSDREMATMILSTHSDLPTPAPDASRAKAYLTPHPEEGNYLQTFALCLLTDAR